MKVSITLFFICLFFSIAADSMGQKWDVSEVKKEDTIIETRIYVDQSGKPLEDTTGTHRIVYKLLNYFVVASHRYSIDNQPTEDTRGVHRKEKFWKYYKFYDKNGKQLLSVKDPYSYEHGDATYCIYNYDDEGNLIEVSYFKDEVVYSNVEKVIVRNRVKAVGAYEGMTHKFVYQHSKGSKTIKEFLFDKNDRLQEQRNLVLKKPKKKKKSKKR